MPNKYKAVRVSAYGKTFDSKHELRVYEVLSYLILKYQWISVHTPVALLGGGEQKTVLVAKKPFWKVDFVVHNSVGTALFAVEAKGIFHEVDKYKFVLWNLFQSIPLIVVHSGAMTSTMRSSGNVHFMSYESYRGLTPVALQDLVLSL